ncbi:MAG: photosystem I reaction center subunit PsaK [Snodgrassella sp.]|nr:photosystem I reaction center subunit PsaK [Snodgrassella sp.]MCO6526177.1 photosystem I reaction center subunit PsaK [Snodgrassella sp.]
MVNDKRFTFKFLGVFMEVINFTPKELRKTMWTAAVILLLLVLTWRLPEMISAIK